MPLNKKVDGKTYELVGLFNGQPLYKTTHNIDALNSTRANFLHSGGGLGLNIEGQNMQIGVWDEFRALKSHIEFLTDNGDENTSRIILGDGSVFNEDETGSHGTHVTGTIAAEGEEPTAIGMAPQSTVLSYTWDDDLSEVEDEATTNALLLSNHSYGLPVQQPNGNIASTWVMGNYNTQARLWDQLHYTAKYYLQVVSAGNDGTVSYSGGTKQGYDKLTGEKNAKNNLVVGNGQDSSVEPDGSLTFPTFINAGSSQGPSDDGRIKPDVIGNGTQVFSTDDGSDSDYSNKTGTSMSAPNVAGTALLLQQHYNDVKGDGSFMLSSTLKGLLCHTATDLGNTGPDAKYGWGLVNAKFAAETITGTSFDQPTSYIEEIELNNNDTYTLNVSKDPNTDLRVTICWTDPAGTSMDGQINSTTPALVNDLDLRITNDNDSEVSEPWKLNLSDVAAVATKGDNLVDTVENIIISNDNPGNYTVEVSHKGNLTSNGQTFSIIVTGVNGVASLDNVAKNQIAVWPNPVENAINFTSPNGFSNASIKIFDLNGRVVKTFKNVTTNKTFSGDLSGVQAGVYIANLTDSNGLNLQKRIIKK